MHNDVRDNNEVKTHAGVVCSDVYCLCEVSLCSCVVSVQKEALLLTQGQNTRSRGTPQVVTFWFSIAIQTQHVLLQDTTCAAPHVAMHCT